MRQIEDREWAAMQHAITNAVAAHAPGWTENRDHDPGVALLQVLAFLADELALREPLPERAAPWKRRIVKALSPVKSEAVEITVNSELWSLVASLADHGPDARVYGVDENGVFMFGDGRHGRRPEPGSQVVARFPDGGGRDGNAALTLEATWPFPARQLAVALGPAGTLRFHAASIVCEKWSGLKRPRYFDGRLLTAADLRDEQAYHLRKHRQHQAALHGYGIVSGLTVETDASGAGVQVGAGIALDPEGREIYLTADCCLGIPEGSASPSLVIMEYAERVTDLVPSPGGQPEATRIEEGCRILLAGTAHAHGVAIARVVRSGKGWEVDRGYRPRRVGA